MKIRSEDELLRVSGSDRIWRIRELTILRGECISGAESKRSAIRRAVVPLAYAHWEGYVKKIGQAYLEYVASQRLPLRDLSICFQSLYFSLENSTDLRKLKRHSLLPILSRLKMGGEDRVHLKTKDVISTQGNLNSEALEDLCKNLGLNFEFFNDHLSFIDKVLLGRRNGIAHGEAYSLSEEDLHEVVEKVVTCIDIFRNEIENSAINKAFLAQAF